MLRIFRRERGDCGMAPLPPGTTHYRQPRPYYPIFGRITKNHYKWKSFSDPFFGPHPPRTNHFRSGRDRGSTQTALPRENGSRERHRLDSCRSARSKGKHVMVADLPEGFVPIRAQQRAARNRREVKRTGMNPDLIPVSRKTGSPGNPSFGQAGFSNRSCDKDGKDTF